MTRYLVVAHQTAESPALRDAVGRIAGDDSDAIFSLLIPATPIEHLGGWTEGESQAVAREVGEAARKRFQEDGATVDDVIVGDKNPVLAVNDAFLQGNWDHVLVSTLPGGVSRWLRRDVVGQLTRHLPVPVTHVGGG